MRPFDFSYRGYDVQFTVAGFYEVFWRGIFKERASSREEAKKKIDSYFGN